MTTVVTQTGPVAMPFTDIELTNAINQLPAIFGQMTAEGYFPADPLPTPYFEIDITNDVISALPVTDGGPATVSKHGAGEARIFKVPQIEHIDNVRANDIRGWVSIASRSRNPMTLADLVNKRLLNFKRKFNLTWELMRISAAKGVIVDGKGNTIIDLFAAFEITKKIVYFDLTNPAADIQGACDLVYQLITQDLSDETMTTVEARVSRQFFNLLVQHPKVEKFYLAAEQALNLVNLARGQDGSYRPRKFTFGNIDFVEYSAVIPMWGGTSSPLIAATKGHAYPAGTQDSHVTYVAPPEDVRVLDGGDADVADAIHITTEALKHGKGVEMLGQLNALPFWRRPKLLVELDSANGSSTTPIGG